MIACFNREMDTKFGFYVENYVSGQIFSLIGALFQLPENFFTNYDVIRTPDHCAHDTGISLEAHPQIPMNPMSDVRKANCSELYTQP